MLSETSFSANTRRDARDYTGTLLAKQEAVSLSLLEIVTHRPT